MTPVTTQELHLITFFITSMAQTRSSKINSHTLMYYSMNKSAEVSFNRWFNLKGTS